MAKVKKLPKDMKIFDCKAIYKCPMIREDSAYPNEIEDLVEVKLTMKKYGYQVNSVLPGYKPKFFYDLYLDWLLYTKYITKVSD